MRKVLVTGATGTVGRGVVEALVRAGGVEVRAAVHTASKGASLQGATVTPVVVDLGRPETTAAAVEGVSHLFLLSPGMPDAVENAKRLVDEARAAGVEHIVKLSVLGADAEPGVVFGRWHREVERHIEASGVAWTHLRPGTFMQNFMTYYPPDREGAISLPFGNGAVAWIDAGDIGEAAARVLTSEGHEGKIYSLTGGEALTVGEVAAILSAATGRPIRHVDIPEGASRDGMLQAGMPAWMVEGMSELFAACRAGYAGSTTEDLPRLLGHAPTTFRAFAAAHAAHWKLG